MSKYEILPQQLLHEGTIKDENLFRPSALNSDRILAEHNIDYWHKLKNLLLTPAEIRRTGFPLSQLVVDREVIIAQGTLECTKYALQYGISMNIAGGTHHAFTYKGEGFCLLNDIAIAARYLLNEKLAKKILVVDLDVHQGNGTAEIFENDTSVFTFSMHGANNYPLIKEKSDLDIGLADHTPDEVYLKLLDANLKHLIDTVQPDFMFFQSGVDILDTDKLGRLNVTREGCKRRDRLVLECARTNKIPLVASMGGGYSPDFRDIIEAHANTYRLAQEIYF
jgi:acetoin utilization deacetylase AcuC-like enzyme